MYDSVSWRDETFGDGNPDEVAVHLAELDPAEHEAVADWLSI